MKIKNQCQFSRYRKIKTLSEADAGKKVGTLTYTSSGKNVRLSQKKDAINRKT